MVVAAVAVVVALTVVIIGGLWAKNTLDRRSAAAELCPLVAETVKYPKLADHAQTQRLIALSSLSDPEKGILLRAAFAGARLNNESLKTYQYGDVFAAQKFCVDNMGSDFDGMYPA